MKSALQWAVYVDLSLHVSQRHGNREVVQILLLLPLVVLVFCRIGISSNNINSSALYLLVYFCETAENDEVLSLLAHNGDGIRNIVVSEDLIWSPVAFSWCPEFILQ